MMYSSVSSSQGQMSVAVKRLLPLPVYSSPSLLSFSLLSHYSDGQMPLPEFCNEAPALFLSHKNDRLTKDLMSSLAAVCRERAIQSFPSVLNNMNSLVASPLNQPTARRTHLEK